MARPQKAHRDDEDQRTETKGEVVPFNREDTKKKVQSFVSRLKEANQMIEDARSNKSIVMKEAISAGLDRKILNKIIKLENMSQSEMTTEAELTKLYAEAIGLQLEFSFA